jgi:hypothetical protein
MAPEYICPVVLPVADALSSANRGQAIVGELAGFQAAR